MAGLLAALLLSLSTTGTLSAFAAAIGNSDDLASTGTVVLQETNGTGSTTCASTDSASVVVNRSSCASINKYGGSIALVPSNGTSNVVATTVAFRNVGTAPASTFTLTPGACAQSTRSPAIGLAADFCSRLDVTIASGSTTIFTGTAAALESQGPLALPAVPAANGASAISVTVSVWLDSSADNRYQGLAGSQPLIWTLGS